MQHHLERHPVRRRLGVDNLQVAKPAERGRMSRGQRGAGRRAGEKDGAGDGYTGGIDLQTRLRIPAHQEIAGDQRRRRGQHYARDENPDPARRRSAQAAVATRLMARLGGRQVRSGIIRLSIHVGGLIRIYAPA